MTDQTVTLRINANAQGVVTGVALAKRETESLGASGERAARQYSSGIGSATSALKSFAIQAAAAFSLRGMVRMADEASNLRARLDLVTDSEDKLAAAIDQTYEIAQRTSTGLSATAELYGRMQKATDSLGRSQADALRSTDLINKTFQVSGTAAATANASIIQLAQGLGAGALRGDEFNSVLEGSPRLAQALTDSLGGNVGRLREMAEAGELTAETIIGALLEQGEAIDAEFAQLPLTVGRAWVQIENAALAAIGNIDREIGASGALAAGLQALVGYIEKIPRAMSLWVDAVDGAGASFDLLLGPVSDVVSRISDEFLILPVSMRTAVTVIIGEFDQLRIGAGEQIDLLVVAGDRAWLAMESSASALAGELEILLGGAIDAVAREYAAFIDGLADGAATLGLDSIASSLRAMSSEIQTAANYEQTIRDEVAASAAAYRDKGAALDATAASISETAAQEIAASQSAIDASLEERAVALLQINTQKELAAASTATGKATVSANQAAGASAKEVAKAVKDQSSALDMLARITRSLTADVSTPAQRAWMDYEDALADITAATDAAVVASQALGKEGKPLVEIFKQQDAAALAAAIALDTNTAAIERQKEAQRQADDVVGNLLASLEEEARLASMTTDQRRVEEIVLRAVADAKGRVNEETNESLALGPAQVATLRQQVAGWQDVITAAHEARQRTEESQRAWTDFGGDLVNAMRGGMRGVKDLFADMLADLARQLLQSTVLRLMSSVFGASMPGLAAAAGAGGQQSMLGAMLGGGGGGFSGLLSSIGGLFGLGGGAGAATPTLMTGMSALPGAAPLAGVGAQAAGGAGLISGSGLGTAFAGVPIIGWIAAAVLTNMSLVRQGWAAGGGSLSLPDGQRVAGGGLPAGFAAISPSAGVDSIFRALGMSSSTASMLSGAAIMTRLFGRQAPQLTGQTTTMSLGAAGAGGSELYRIIERGGLFRSDRRSTRSGALGTEAQDAAQALFDSVRDVMVDSARALQGEAPAMLDAALRAVVEYDKKGKITATKFFVDVLGRTWEEATAEAATQRIAAEGMIATIDAIIGTTVAAASESVATGAADVIGAAGDGAMAGMDRAGNVFDSMVRKVEAVQGEASAIAERWRDDAATLADGAQMLLAAAVDMRNGNALLGQDSTLTQIADLIGELQAPGEALAATYGRVSASVALLDQALALSGESIDKTREEVVRLAVDIVDMAGGLERAQGLWGRYFDTFYTETERLEFQVAQATERASQMFAEAGLNLGDFTGTGGAAAFRDLFESQLQNLSAAGVVQYLELAEALGILIDLTGQTTEAVDGVSGSLADLMSSVAEQLAQYAPPMTFAERLQAINAETDTMIAQARALGATEAQLGEIRALSAARLGEVLDEQAAAMSNYQSVVAGVRDELADARGLTEYQRELREVDRWLASTTANMTSAARAAGMQGAAEEDLAMAHEVAAIRASQAMARLTQRGRDLAVQLYGTALDQIDAQISEIGNGVSAWAGNVQDGMSSVTDATNQAVQAQISAQQRIREWLDGIMATELSGLRPKDQLTEALALFEREQAAATGGDAAAAGRLPQLADTILRLGQSVYGSSRGFFDLRDLIIGRMRDLADLIIEDPVGTGGGGSGTGGGATDQGGFGQDALSAERARLAAEQNAAERRALAQELAAVIRDMTARQEVPLAEIEATLGISMRDLVADLGVNLSEMTAATAGQLAGIAQSMGVELTDLAGSVGVSLGSLADRQSLLNDALEGTLARLPQGQRDQLEPLLRNVEEAAALGDTAGVEAGIADMEEAIGRMSPSIRDALAPFFAAIRPADPATEIGHLSSMDTVLAASHGELQAQTQFLSGIYDVLSTPALPSTPAGPLNPGGSLGGPPGYAVGTSYVPNDGLAYLHQGEMVFPAAVSDFFRREGIPILAPPPQSAPSGDSYAELVAELRALRRERAESDAYLQRMELRIQQLETTTARGDEAKVRAMDRQTDALKRSK